MSIFGSTTQVGVSIGTSSIKIAELKKSGRAYTLQKFGTAPLPEDVINNREIINHMAVVDALQQLVKQMKIKGKPAVTSVSGSGVIVKKILIDQTPEKDLSDAVLWEAEQYIPFDINDVVFDFQILEKNGQEGKMEIILVACKRNLVESFEAVLRDSGLDPSCIDVDFFSLQNIFEANYPIDTPSAIIDIGASSLKLVVCHNGQPLFTRDTAIGGKALTNEIQKHLNLSFQEAELIKIDGSANKQMPQEVSDLISVTCDNFASEIKRSIDFFSASNNSAQIAYVLLSGGSSNLPNLSKTIEDLIRIPVQVMNPFNSISYDASIFSPEYISSIAGISAIPMGLGIRGFLK